MTIANSKVTLSGAPSSVPQWRKDRCVHCAAELTRGLGLSCSGHRMPNQEWVPCTAPTPKEYIANLTMERDKWQKLAEELEREADSWRAICQTHQDRLEKPDQCPVCLWSEKLWPQELSDTATALRITDRSLHAMQEKVDELRATLEPFAKYGRLVTALVPDTCPMATSPCGRLKEGHQFTVGNCRRAAEVLDKP